MKQSCILNPGSNKIKATKNNTIKVIKITALALLVIFVGCQSEKKISKQEIVIETKKPNILILLADDMGYGDIGAYGN